MADSVKSRIQSDVKDAMRARDRQRLGVLRMVSAAIKQKEVDSRTELEDTQVLQVLDKMIKQRRDAEAQFRDAGRPELADQEAYEVTVISAYMPEALDPDSLAALVDEAVASVGATSMKDMGQVMGFLRPKLQGRADMGAVSATVKARLSG